EVQLTIGSGGKPVENAAFAAGSGGTPGDAGKPGATAPGGGGPPWMLALALLGGLILNAMPCVLPVLSLKVFGLVRSAGHGRTEVVRGALATAAGILVSFIALALAAIAAKAAGAAVGWGIQFQRPGFVAFLPVGACAFC